MEPTTNPELHPSSSVFDLTAAELREEGYAADFIAAVEAQRRSDLAERADREGWFR